MLQTSSTKIFKKWFTISHFKNTAAGWEPRLLISKMLKRRFSFDPTLCHRKERKKVMWVKKPFDISDFAKTSRYFLPLLVQRFPSVTTTNNVTVAATSNNNDNSSSIKKRKNLQSFESIERAAPYSSASWLLPHDERSHNNDNNDNNSNRSIATKNLLSDHIRAFLNNEWATTRSEPTVNYSTKGLLIDASVFSIAGFCCSSSWCCLCCCCCCCRIMFSGFFPRKKSCVVAGNRKSLFRWRWKEKLFTGSAQRQNISNLIICGADSNPGNKKRCLKKSYGSFQTFYFHGLNGNDIFFSAHLLFQSFPMWWVYFPAWQVVNQLLRIFWTQ